MHLIEVAFKGNRKEFYSWEGESPPPVRSSVVVEADRGEDLGVVHSVGEAAAHRCAGCSHGIGATPPARKALRVASSREVRQAEDLHAQDDTARRKATDRVKAHGLVMKLSDAEWQWDRKKLTFYFTAEKRVDFRNLVRDLAALFRARIELKQIGVRDEAKRLDGIGRCGRQYCSASWLPDLRPVNLGVAKDQHLSLNPSQISGACGRLMCCLRYEHEFYVQSRARFPKEGRTVVTTAGEGVVIANDIFNERVTLRMADGETRIVPLAEVPRASSGGGGSGGRYRSAAAGAESLSEGDDSTVADGRPGLHAPQTGEDEPAQDDVLDSDDRVEGVAVTSEWPTHGFAGRGVASTTLAESGGPDDELGAAAAASTARETVERGDSEGPPTSAPDLAAGESASEGPEVGVPRRRRGRRGGRRSRGKGGGASGGSPPAGPPSSGPAA